MKNAKKTRAKNTKKERARKDVIATRRSCGVKGTGLSHYILMDNRKK